MSLSNNFIYFIKTQKVRKKIFFFCLANSFCAILKHWEIVTARATIALRAGVIVYEFPARPSAWAYTYMCVCL